MSVIEIKNLTFGYDNQGEDLFREAQLIIQTQWKLGLVGRNGRGKTTLLNLLQGKLPYQGTISQPVSFTYFPQKVTDFQQLTYYVLTNLADFEDWQIKRELNLLHLDAEDILWRPFATLSGGEQTKVLLALLFVDDKNFPLIDEPTNHLDFVSRRQVAEYLQKKQGFIVVSHDRKFVDQVVDHILAIEKSQLVLYQGNYATYQEQKKLRDQTELAENQKLKNEIGRLKETSRKKAEWSRGREKDKYGKPNVKGSGAVGDTGGIGARAARVMKKAKNLEHRMEKEISNKEKLLKDIEYIDPLKINSQPSHHKLLLKVENLQLSYEGKALFEPISFEVRAGERLAIQGANGSGKSSIIAWLRGEFLGAVTGEILRPENLAISYVRQNYEDNFGKLPEFAESHQLSYQDLLNNLKKLGFERSVFQNPIEDMSMGQKKRVELAKSLATPAEIYIWDEPLNYVDVFNQEQLEEMIQTFQPTMLIVEHDATFLEKVATKIIYLQKAEESQ